MIIPPRVTIENAIARARHAARVINDAKPRPPRELADELATLLYQLSLYADQNPDAAPWVRSEIAGLRATVLPPGAEENPPGWAVLLLYHGGVLNDLTDDDEDVY